MSEKEKNAGGGAESSLVLVEKSTASRHRQPFRPTDMQEDTPPDLHKRSKAPAVPSVGEEFKESVHSENKEKKETISSETHIHSASKKLSSNKRPSSPETITMAPLQTDAKRSIIAPLQPLPPEVSSVTSAVPDRDTDKNVAENKDEDDSITEEIAGLRTPEVVKKSSEWVDNSGDSKKEVSWNDENYFDTVKLEDCTSNSQHCVLGRKTSIGPCYRSAAPFGRPSGITICLTKKSTSTVHEQNNPKKSIINITVSKNQDESKGHFLGSLRQRISNMGDKIRNVFV